MRLPGRLRVAWQDDRTLTIETDAGSQVRTLRFVAAAAWRRRLARELAGLMGSHGGADGCRDTLRRRRVWRWQCGGGSLKVVTKGMKPGYLRKNGVPYSADAVITEYFDRFDLPGGDALMVVSTEVVDPRISRSRSGPARISRSSATPLAGSRCRAQQDDPHRVDDSPSRRDCRRGALRRVGDRHSRAGACARAGSGIRPVGVLVAGAA